MKSNRSQELVELAIRNLPQTLEYRDARIMLSKALHELATAEKKHDKKKTQLTPLEKWQLDTKTGNLVSPFMNEQQRKSALDQIESLIQTEKAKLNPPSQNTDLFTD